jgi:hypothetical protein
MNGRERRPEGDAKALTKQGVDDTLSAQVFCV